jgi:DNA-binding MarR family transcriptional regulator
MNDALRRGMKSDSISGQSAANFVTENDTLASLLLNHGITVRDFILLSFLSDQGSLSVLQLARVVDIEPETVFQSVKRLSAASLVLRDPNSTDTKTEIMVTLTGRGEQVASRISDQLA